MSEKRKHKRFEPRFLKATLIIEETNQELKGNIIDTSEESVAIIFESELNLQLNQEVKIKVEDTKRNIRLDLGNAKLIRKWNTPNFLENKPAAAFKLNESLKERHQIQTLLRGIPKDDRFIYQAKLAEMDIEYLCAYRRSLIDCQMKLFMLVLTTGVALGSAYFGLAYHGSLTGNINDSDLSFWRGMIAALPGLLAVGSAFMVAQKSISIQRIDAYLSIMKECYLSKRFPREYKGWESEYRKFRRILHTSRCNNCTTKCGSSYSSSNSESNFAKMFKNPPPDYYHIIVYSIFLIVILLSIYAVVVEVVKYQAGDYFKMFISAFITIILFTTIICLLFIFKELRYGRYSLKYFRKTWCELLNRCNVASMEF